MIIGDATWPKGLLRTKTLVLFGEESAKGA